MKGPRLLSINDPRKTQWDLFVMILATFNVFVIPLDVGFQPESFQSFLFRFFNYIVDAFFFLDILVSFRTTYINERTGAEVKDVKLIGRYYLRGQFTIDLLATLPFDAIGEVLFSSDNATFKIFGALKLVRVLRLSKIITYLRSTEEFKAFLKLNKLIFFLIIYLHCFGCIWWMLVSGEEEWIPPMNFNDSDWYYVYKQSIYYRYFVALHAAVLLTTGNDCGPQGTLQVTVASFGLFMGAIINANIFGELAVLVSQLNARSTDF